MLAENLENLVNRERSQAEQIGIMKTKRETALNLIKRTDMDDAMIADIAGLTLSEVTELRSQTKH